MTVSSTLRLDLFQPLHRFQDLFPDRVYSFFCFVLGFFFGGLPSLVRLVLLGVHGVSLGRRARSGRVSCLGPGLQGVLKRGFALVDALANLQELSVQTLEKSFL